MGSTDICMFLSFSAEDEECMASSPDSNVHGSHYNDTIIESSDLEVSSILSGRNPFRNTSSTQNKRRNMSDSSTLREVFIDSDIETDIGTFSTNSPLTSNFDRRTRFVYKWYHLFNQKSLYWLSKISDFSGIREC